MVGVNYGESLKTMSTSTSSEEINRRINDLVDQIYWANRTIGFLKSQIDVTDLTLADIFERIDFHEAKVAGYEAEIQRLEEQLNAE